MVSTAGVHRVLMVFFASLEWTTVLINLVFMDNALNSNMGTTVSVTLVG